MGKRWYFVMSAADTKEEFEQAVWADTDETVLASLFHFLQKRNGGLLGRIVETISDIHLYACETRSEAYADKVRARYAAVIGCADLTKLGFQVAAHMIESTRFVGPKSLLAAAGVDCPDHPRRLVTDNEEAP